jgi:hypothetical protein
MRRHWRDSACLITDRRVTRSSHSCSCCISRRRRVRVAIAFSFRLFDIAAADPPARPRDEERNWRDADDLLAAGYTLLMFAFGSVSSDTNAGSIDSRRIEGRPQRDADAASALL